MTAALRTLLVDELALATTQRMVASFGGEERCLERFLTARQGDAPEAAAMFCTTAALRRQHGVDDDPPRWLPEEVHARIDVAWPGAFCRCTNDYSGVSFFRLGQLDVSHLLELATEDEWRQYYLEWMERSLEAQRQARAEQLAAAAAADEPGGGLGECAEPPWRGMVEVYDFAGLSLSSLNMAGVRMLARVLSAGQGHYPENLRKAIMLNAPLGFATAFSVVSAVLSEATVSKIEIRRDDGAELLEEVLGSRQAVEAMYAAVPIAERATATWGEYLGVW